MSKNATPAPHIESDIQSVRALRDEDLEVAAVGGGAPNSTLSNVIKSIGEGLTKMASKQ